MADAQKMPTRVLNWDKIKSEVDIEAYFLHKMGNFFTFDKYKRAYVARNSDGTVGDIIRFFPHRDTGVKMYYSISHQDSGDIIQFIKNRILKDSAASYYKINEELRLFLGSTTNFEIHTETLSKKNNITPAQKFHINGNIIQNIDRHLNYLTKYRRISRDTINSAEFIRIFFDYETDNIHTLSYYLKNIQGEIVGINRIQSTDNQYFNKKWFAPNTNNSAGFAWSREVEKTETLSVFESIFDAMAFKELYSPEKMQFVATNGELSFRKAGLLVEYFNDKKLKNWLLCNDKDLAGQYFNLNIIGNIIPIFWDIRKSAKHIKIDIVSEKDHPKLKLVLRFFKKTEKSFDFEPQEELPQLYFQEILPDDRTKTSLLIASASQSVHFFVSLLIDIFDLKQTVQVRIPENKDFNEDLIQRKLSDGQKRSH